MILGDSLIFIFIYFHMMPHHHHFPSNSIVPTASKPARPKVRRKASRHRHDRRGSAQRMFTWRGLRKAQSLWRPKGNWVVMNQDEFKMNQADGMGNEQKAGIRN